MKEEQVLQDCYSIALAKLIGNALPDGFEVKQAFDNKRLILDIAAHLYGTK